MLINVIVTKNVTEILISWLQVDICDIRVSISYFDQILRKREPQTRQGFNFANIYFHEIVVLKLFAGTEFCENGQKLRNVIPLR